MKKGGGYLASKSRRAVADRPMASPCGAVQPPPTPPSPETTFAAAAFYQTGPITDRKECMQ